MITVYRYGFEIPKPAEEPQTPVLTYPLLAVAAVLLMGGGKS